MARLIPRKTQVDNPHIIVEGDRYTVVSTGEVVTTNQYGSPLNGDALAQAIRFHGFPGVVVWVSGNQHKGFHFNDKTHPSNTNAVIWGGDENVRDVTIVGQERARGTRTGLVSVWDKTGDIRLENLTMVNSPNAFAPFMVRQGSIAGKMTMYGIDFDAETLTTWGGKGMKWNIRAQGSAQWDCRGLRFHKAVEHGAYVDNHQGNSYWVNCQGGEMGRTLLQFPNRASSGPGAFGDLVVKNCIAMNNMGDGGSDFTFYGNGEGTIWFLNNKSIGNTAGSQGAFTHNAYNIPEQGGWILTDNGFVTKRLIISNFVVDHPNANRNHVSINGVDQTIIASWQIEGNKTAVTFDTPFGDYLPNGSVKFFTRNNVPVSQWEGWDAAQKVKMGSDYLTDDQLDDLQFVR